MNYNNNKKIININKEEKKLKLNDNSYTKSNKLTNNFPTSTSFSFYEKIKLSNKKINDNRIRKRWFRNNCKSRLN